MKDDEASYTALTVAQGMLYTASRAPYQGLILPEEKEAYQAILSSTPQGEKRLRRLNNPFFRFLVPIREKLFMPGITLHYGLRKRFIEDQARQAIARGYGQVVNLGAGFDSLCYRLSREFPEVRFFELDHPATSKLKREFFESADFKRTNVSLLPVDFTRDTAETILRESETYRQNEPAFFILEGVTMYLSEEEVRQLFESLVRLTGEKASIAFTYLHSAPTGSYGYGPLLKLFLKIKSEALRWRTTPEELPAFVESMGYKLLDHADAQALRDRYLSEHPSAPSHEAELLALAERFRS